jgi:Ring hydroxylating alpha subunit (catalytic domain)
MEVLGPPQRWLLPLNWKLVSENFSVDSHHTLTLHRSIIDIGLIPNLDDLTATGISLVADPQMAHATLLLQMPFAQLPPDDAMAGVCALVGRPPDAGPELERNLDAAQIGFARDHFPGVGNVFPNFAWLKGLLSTELGGDPFPGLTIRLVQPISPTETEMWSWAMAHRDSPPELKTAMRRSILRSFGTSGMIEQDDVEVWKRIPRSAAGAVGRAQAMNYIAERDPDPDWPHPGLWFNGYPTEDVQWYFYLRWRELLGK